jgi:hypothetical protein
VRPVFVVVYDYAVLCSTPFPGYAALADGAAAEAEHSVAALNSLLGKHETKQCSADLADLADLADAHRDARTSPPTSSTKPWMPSNARL